ncbi:MAG: hypothetical protein K0R68_2461 [Mycobacterium sp.]|nr:hypothetical protein [Mycobacterium sp.]
MVGGTLAAAGLGETAGHVVGLLVIPALGLVLMIVGLIGYRRRRPDPQPQYRQYPTAPGYPPVWHPAPPPGRQRQSAGAITMIVVGCVVVVLGLAGAGLAALGGPDESALSPAELQVGQCITDGQYAEAEMAPEATDCSRGDAVYELASRGTGPSAVCPDGLREDSGYAVLFNSSATLCFVLNVAEGQCFVVAPEAQLFTPVDCSDPAANSKIDRIFDGVEDLSLCPAGPQGAAFPQPVRTYCVVPPD